MLIPDDDGVLHIAILTEISKPQPRIVSLFVSLDLYTNSNGGPYRLQVNNINNLANSGFNPQNPTKILIHGFSGNGKKGIIIEGKNAYLGRGDYNIIGVDWGLLAAAPNYPFAVLNTRPVGEHVAELIDFLVAQTGARLEDFHLIGHSLGAHVAGFAGKSTTTGKVGRITGLDPANPLFNNVGPDGRLDAGDAVVVDTIQTDGDGLGLLAPIGLVSFYPNGGRRVQPGCSGITDILTGACSHGRSVDFFIYSITNPDAFPARECLNLNQALIWLCTGTATAFMGDALRFERPGIYFVDTRNVPVRQQGS